MKVLALSPHTDDVELGCGGYLNKLHEQGHEIYVIVFSDCSTHWDLPLRDECKKSLSLINAKVEIWNCELRKFDGQEILDALFDYEADMVLLPSSSDIHQDHQVIHQEGVRAFSRKCQVLGYELPYNCRGFKPNYYVDLQEKHIVGKLKMI